MTHEFPVTSDRAGTNGVAATDGHPAVVEFGGADERDGPGGARAPVASRWGLSRVLSASWRTPRFDARVVPVIAGVGALAVFASFIGEWQVSTIDSEELVRSTAAEGLVQVSAGVNEIGALGTGYLFGVFAVVTCLALVLFGAPAVRQHARVAGLGLSGVLLGLLVATAVELDRSSAVFPLFFLRQQPPPPVSYGRGMYMAFLGVAAFGLALYLAGRLAPPPSTSDALSGAGSARQPAPRSDPGGAGEMDGLWSWRRRRVEAEATADEPAGPPDLTVSPAAPFTQLSERTQQW